jgi:CubicO group peptidase (beta-lactamase class C family)/polyisoprenoid-binding protein YceI
MRSRLIGLLGVLIALAVSGRAGAERMEFDFKDPKEISAVSLSLDSMLEPIVGYAKGLSGTIQFDPANPKASTGRVAVDVSSVQFANEGYTQTARGFALRGDKYPQIFFTLRKVLRVRRTATNIYQAVIEADFTCKGVTIPMTMPVTASYFPGRAQERTNGKFKGDVLVIRTGFGVSRTRLGVSEGIPIHMVGDIVRVGVAVVGIHYAPGQRKPEPASQKTTTFWKMEIEDRDEPRCVDAEFDLNAAAPKAIFKTAGGALEATNVSLTNGKLTFDLPSSPLAGASKGEAFFTNDTVHGQLKSSAGTLPFHGKVKRASEEIVKGVPVGVTQGPGFQDLHIKADGRTWSLSERMKFYHVPGVSLARIENFQIVETGAFGVTNVETGEPADENTLFQAGGMGSPLVDMLAFRLAALGKLDLKRAANAYLKSAHIPESDLTKRRAVTVLDLLNGASGLTQYKFTGYPPRAKIPTLAELMRGADPAEMEPLDVKSAPGTYGGQAINTAVLEQVIEDALGRPLPELMQEYLFEPFGMTHSLYEPYPAVTRAHRVALGHYTTGELTLDKAHLYSARGVSGLWTTADDFAQALCQVQLMLAGRPNRLLTNGQRDLLDSLTAGPWILGLIKTQKDDFLPLDYLYHGGASYGYYANHATQAHGGCGLVVMQNRNLSWRLHNEIVRAAAKQHGWQTAGAPKSPSLLQAQMDQPVTLDFSLPVIAEEGRPVTSNLSTRKADKNLVLFFLNEQCGVTYFYKKRIQQLQKDFEGKGFVFVGVRCGKKEKPSEPIQLAETKYLQMPFVDDDAGAVMRYFRVRQSVTFVVIDREGRLRYQGGFDDNVDEKRARKSYLRDALNAIAAGKDVAMKEGKIFGCAIIPSL